MPQQRNTQSVSQSEIVNEKIVSGKEGTVTEAALNQYEPSNKIASTKYVDDSEQNSAPQGVKSTSIVHQFEKAGDGTPDVPIPESNQSADKQE